MTLATVPTQTVQELTQAAGKNMKLKNLLFKNIVIPRLTRDPEKAAWIPAYIGMAAIILLVISHLVSPITTTAQQSPLQIQFSPNNATLKTGDEQIITLRLESPEKISALDLKFSTSGSLEITDFRDSLTTNNNLNPFEYKLVKESVQTPEASYIFTTANLPTSVTLYIKIKGSITGESKLTIDYNNSQVTNGNGSLLQIQPNQSAAFSLNQTQSSPNFIDPNSLPSLNYPSSAAIVNLKLKLYGALPKAVTNLKGTIVAVGRNGDSKNETQPEQINLSQNPDGTFSGKAAFPNFKDGTKFSLMIKVDKYLLRRICDASPFEAKPSEYTCKDPSLTIRQGDNSFDFSKVSLLPGDLGLIDGVLNGYDLSIVRNNLGQSSKESTALADLNYDGIVNDKDFEIITTVAGNTNRKADD